MPGGSALLLNLLSRSWLGSTTPPTSVGDTDDNIIQLGGQNLAVRGISTVEQVSEFESGIKVGPATYDNREHAFFIIMNDHSAGMGYRFVDVREELGGFWTPDKENAADTSREKYLVLPPKQTTVQDTTPTATQIGSDITEWNWTRSYAFNSLYTERFFMVFGSAIYVSYDGGRTFTRTYDSGGGSLLTITESFSEPNGLPIMVASGHTQRYVQSDGAGGVTFTNGTRQVSLDSLMWWDKKLLALDVFGCEFAVWATDPDTFVSDLEWNVANPLDGDYIFKYNNAGHLRWIGTGQAPWGQPSPYFHDRRRMYVLDFFARKFYPIELGFGRPILGSAEFNGSFDLSDGFNVWEYSPNGQTVRNIGMRDAQGLPPSFQAGNGGEYQIHHLIPADKDLYAIANTKRDLSATNPRSILMKFNGKGWHQVGKPVDYWAVAGSAIYSSYGGTPTRQIVIWGTDDINDATANVYHTYYELPVFSDTPLPTREHFGDTGASFTGGWMNGGFNDLDGTLLRMRIDAMYLTATERVKVEFQLDNDESGTWYQLVNSSNVPSYFDNTNETLYFSTSYGDPSDYEPRKGIEFNAVRFRVTLYRGSDETLSPVVKALILMYIKVPEFRAAATFTVDVNRHLSEIADSTYYVDGAHPTMRDLHQKLISLWDSHTLHHLIVPNVITAEDNCYVRIVGMPLRFEDFRDAVAGRGSIELSVLEPLERVD